MSWTWVLLGGELQVDARLQREAQAAERVIAADAGIRHAEALGVPVDLWVGDFDSTPPALVARYARVPREAFPPDKDKTDGELAILAALARGARRIVLAGALGGEMDHAAAHLLLAVRLAEEGVAVRLTRGNEEAYPLVPGRLALELTPGTRLSVLPLTDLEGLTIRGARWPLERARVPFASTWVLRNEARGAVTLDLARGRAVVFVYS